LEFGKEWSKLDLTWEANMYNVFDSFLSGSTWHTRHPTDEKEFFIGLHKVIRDEKFSPEAMGDYMRDKLN
jgi:hypothetical protein